jgi:hypothetical protein
MMEKKHKVLLWGIAALVAVCSYIFQLDYRNIASEGISLTSIVLAVYVAAMMGLIGAKLGEKLAKIPSKNPEYTQLWVLRKYFSNAVIASVLTIIASSLILLLPERSECEPMSNAYLLASSLSLAVYAVNLVYMGFIMKFMLNRQIWDA